MVELSIFTPAWQNYIKHLNDLFNSRRQIARVDTMTAELNRDYNGIVIDNDISWRVYFKSEQDMTYFVLKWS